MSAMRPEPRFKRRRIKPSDFHDWLRRLARFHKSNLSPEEIFTKFDGILRRLVPNFEAGFIADSEFYQMVTDSIVRFIDAGVIFGNHYWLEREAWILLGLDPERFRIRRDYRISVRQCTPEAAAHWLVGRFPDLKKQELPAEDLTILSSGTETGDLRVDLIPLVGDWLCIEPRIIDRQYVRAEGPFPLPWPTAVEFAREANRALGRDVRCILEERRPPESLDPSEMWLVSKDGEKIVRGKWED